MNKTKKPHKQKKQKNPTKQQKKPPPKKPTPWPNIFSFTSFFKQAFIISTEAYSELNQEHNIRR